MRETKGSNDVIGGDDIYEVPLPPDYERQETDSESEETDLSALLNDALDEAIQWRDENLDPDQAKATDYYKKRPFGNEEEGRSQVVMSELKDAVQAVLPSLMRVFFGPERVLQFRAEGLEDKKLSEQQTDYVDHVFKKDNPGFLILHSTLKDALIRKLGIIKWWWDTSTKVKASKHSGLSPEAIAVLAQEPYNTLTDLEEHEDGTYSCTVRCEKEVGRVHIAGIPNEEFVWSPGARDRDDAEMVAHIRNVPASDLVAMGVPQDVIDEALEELRPTTEGSLITARRFDESTDDAEERDESRKKLQFAEVYMYVDLDDDGIAELRFFQCVGPKRVVVNGEDGEGEIVDERPFALFCPNPEPHEFVGDCVSDDVMDLQLIKSMVWRGLLDSLAATLDPATEVVEGEVNMADVLNTEIGRIIRVRKPQVMREVVTPFVGEGALPVLGYLDEVSEQRTGRHKGAQGIDADTLQSSTKAAVSAQLTAAQQHIELIARIFAETGMKQLFSGILRLVTRHQDEKRTVRLRNEWVEVDPRHWDADKDLDVNVGLGAGMTEEKLNALAIIMEKQETMLQLKAPLVKFSDYRNTLARAIELIGFPSADEFFQPWGPEQDEKLAQMEADQPPPPDPTTMMLQVETMKAQAQMQYNEQKIQIELQKAAVDADIRRQELQMKIDLERDRMAREFALKEAELELKHAAEIEDMKLKAAIERDRLAMEKQETKVDGAE